MKHDTTTKVVRVKSWAAEQGDYVDIFEADFDPDTHKIWVKPTRVPRVKKAAEAGASEAEDNAD